MLNTLPAEVDYCREFQASGEGVYVFSHPTIGVLGDLHLVPHRGGSRIIWNPYHLKKHSFTQTHLEDFMEELIGELRETVKLLYKAYLNAPLH